MSGLRRLINGTIIYQFPLGFGYDNLIKYKDHFISKSKLQFKNTVDYECLLNVVDLIIINAEGTIHHENLGAHVLLNFITICKKLNKKVFIVNGSIFELNKSLINKLKLCDKIFVREIESQNYLLEYGVKSKLVLDCAFLNQFNSEPKSKKVLYTPGVLFCHGHQKRGVDLQSILKAHFDSIRLIDDSPIFLKIEPLELSYTVLWTKLGGEVLDCSKMSTADLIGEISRYDLVISGRYHILLFSLMAKVRTIPLSSNTKKIHGLYKSFTNSEVFVQSAYTSNLDINKSVNLIIDLNHIRANIIKEYDGLFNNI